MKLDDDDPMMFKLIQEYISGKYTRKQIIHKYDISYAILDGIIRRKKLPTLRTEIIKPEVLEKYKSSNLTIKEIAFAFNIGTDTVTRIVRKEGLSRNRKRG